MEFIDKMLDARRDAGHGPWGEAQGGWVDNKPYSGHWHPGLFEGYDGSVWMYFEVPQDVRLQWLSSESEVIENQHFFIDLAKDIAKMLGGETSTKRDIRREFHLVATQHPSGGIIPYEGCTPQHADYLKRMSDQYTKPVWRGFFGLRLIESNIFHETYGFHAKLRRYIDALRNPGNVQWLLLKQDIDEVNSLMARHNFPALDFTTDQDALERLTAWYGVPDDQFTRPIQTQTQRLQEPVHGRSIITPRFGEMSFYALVPDENIDIRDPVTYQSRWGEALYRPDADAAAISIRGQIRSVGASDNLLDIKALKNKNDTSEASLHSANIADLINMSRNLVIEDRMPMIDNVEIVVGSIVPKQEVAETNLVRTARDMGMRAALLVDRQPLALLSTLPTYPRHVSRVPKRNSKRPPLTNVMMPGALAFSGIFRANKPAGSEGIILGLGDVGYQYPEIFIDPSGASKENKSPVMFVSGRPGAGKTMQLTQMTAQAAYMGLPSVFLNPKATGTLKPFFDQIGGSTISMNTKYLDDNPGLLDPTFFLESRADVASILTDAIFAAMRMYDDVGSAASEKRTRLAAEIRERALQPENLTSYHILFGNPHRGTLPITDVDIRNFVANKIQTSPFWKAFISVNTQSNLTKTLKEAKTLLIEWGAGMDLPDAGTDRYTDAQIDSILSVTTVFRYSITKVEGSGGMIVVDESWILKSSPEARKILERGGREWRQANIMLVLGSQRIQDWAGVDGQAGQSDLRSFISRFLFMAISENDDDELDAYFKLTGLARTAANERYIINAAAERAKGGKIRIARGYLVDTVHKWEGGLICGPWPEAELNMGRTDHEAQRAREAQEGRSVSGYGGALGGVVDDQLGEENPDDNSDW